MPKRALLLAAIVVLGAAPAHASARPTGTLVFYSDRDNGLYGAARPAARSGSC